MIDLEQANNILRNLMLNEISLEWNVSGTYEGTYSLTLDDKGLSCEVSVEVSVPFTTNVEASDEEIATEEVEGMDILDLDLDWDNADIKLSGSEVALHDLDELVLCLSDNEPNLGAEIVVEIVEQV